MGKLDIGIVLFICVPINVNWSYMKQIQKIYKI